MLSNIDATGRFLWRVHYGHPNLGVYEDFDGRLDQTPWGVVFTWPDQRRLYLSAESFARIEKVRPIPLCPKCQKPLAEDEAVHARCAAMDGVWEKAERVQAR